MHLPTELWMMVLESLRHDEYLARPVFVKRFVKDTLEKSATEEDLVRALPSFERCGAWKATRSYYAIDSTIRKAAQQVLLSAAVLLPTCSVPHDQVPRKRGKGMRTAHLKAKGGVFDKRYGVPDVIAKMQPRLGKNGELEPSYLALDMFAGNVAVALVRAMDVRFRAMELRQNRWTAFERLFVRHRESLMVRDNTVLGTVRRVDLLATSPYEDLNDQARELAKQLARCIEMVWVQMGIEDGVVRVLD